MVPKHIDTYFNSQRCAYSPTVKATLDYMVASRCNLDSHFYLYKAVDNQEFRCKILHRRLEDDKKAVEIWEETALFTIKA